MPTDTPSADISKASRLAMGALLCHYRKERLTFAQLGMEPPPPGKGRRKGAPPSQSHVARAMRLTTEQVANYERGRVLEPKLHRLHEFAEVLHMDPEDRAELFRLASGEPPAAAERPHRARAHLRLVS